MKKLLFDECIPRKLKRHFGGFDCTAVPEAGWAGKRNGELLTLAEEAGFEVFLTLDHGIEYEQNFRDRRISLISIQAKSSRLDDLIALVPKVVSAIEFLKPGEKLRVS